jgi:hypothetical protein
MEGRATAIGVDTAGQREYFSYWSKGDVVRDLIQQRTRVYRTGAVETDQDILPRSELLRSAFGCVELRKRCDVTRLPHTSTMSVAASAGAPMSQSR